MWLDLSILFLFLTYSLTIGFVMRKKASRGLVDYFLAGRSLKGWQAGCSMAATQYAADTPLLVAGLVATGGIFSLWRLWVYGIAFLLMGFLLGGCWQRARVLTDAELTEIRYSGTAASVLRILKAIHMGTLINCTVLAMVLIAATRIAENFLPWHEWLPEGFMQAIASALEKWDFTLTAVPRENPDVWLRSADNLISIGIIVVFTWLYSTTGGLRSVVATDVVQFSITMVGTAFYAFVVIQKIGGVGQLGVQLQSLYGSEARDALLSFGPSNFSEGTVLFLSVLAIQWFGQVSADGTGYLAQRMMGCATDKDAKVAAVIFTFMQVVLRSLLWLPIIIGLLVLYPASEILEANQFSEAFRVEREGTFAQGMRDLLPIGLRGLMLTGMLAALASTVDTHLNWGASYWTNDLYKRFVMEKFFRRHPSQRELVWIARFSNLGILVTAIWIMEHLASIRAAWHLTLLFGSGLGVVLILRWIWYRINLWSEITAGAVSLILSPILLFAFPDASEGLRLIAMVLISTFCVIFVTLLTPPETEETLKNFYLRVRPAGFWGPVARAVHESPQKPVILFKKAILSVGLASLSAFGLLVGVGQLFTGYIVNVHSWAPYAMIFASLSLIPLWVFTGFFSDEK